MHFFQFSCSKMLKDDKYRCSNIEYPLNNKDEEYEAGAHGQKLGIKPGGKPKTGMTSEFSVISKTSLSLQHTG